MLNLPVAACQSSSAWLPPVSGGGAGSAANEVAAMLRTTDSIQFSIAGHPTDSIQLLVASETATTSGYRSCCCSGDVEHNKANLFGSLCALYANETTIGDGDRAGGLQQSAGGPTRSPVPVKLERLLVFQFQCVSSWISVNKRNN